MGSSSPIRPGRADDDVTGRDPQDVGDLLRRGVGVGEALGAGARVGAAGVEDHRVDPAVADDLTGPGDGGRLDPVAGEDGRAVVVGTVVDDEREVGGTAGLEAGGDP